MTRRHNVTLLSLVEAYFRSYLAQARGVSAHTTRAYRDTLRLLFKFLAERGRCPVAALTLDDLHVDGVLAFLSHLEAKRGNSVASRNLRFAAIRSLFRHLVEHDLTRAGQYQRVLSLPNKRARLRAANYLRTSRRKAASRPTRSVNRRRTP